MLFPENIGEYLSIDELSLSKGELYTFVTNKKGRGKKGSLVASIRGTLSKDIIAVLEKLPLDTRKIVKEVTLDMANNMESSARQSFPCSDLVTDRFHVEKLVIDALQHIRIKFRWEELDKENLAIDEAKKLGKKYKPVRLGNGDSPKQLLARCRYIIAKKPNQWTKSQHLRASILFKRYPMLLKAYQHVLEFRSIYELKSKTKAEQRFLEWINKSSKLKIKEFNTAANSVKVGSKNANIYIFPKNIKNPLKCF